MATQEQFCKEVGERAAERYDVEDGSDLCFNLIEMGVIVPTDGVAEAARIVAQHVLQA